jgi:hypothetical protein
MRIYPHPRIRQAQCAADREMLRLIRLLQNRFLPRNRIRTRLP